MPNAAPLVRADGHPSFEAWKRLSLFGAGAISTGALFYGTTALALSVADMAPAMTDGQMAVAWGAVALGWYLFVHPRPVPGSRLQMNRQTAGLPGLGLVLYGAVLGIGVATIVSTPLVWLGFVFAVIAGSVGWGVAYGVGFAVGRALPLLVENLLGTSASQSDIALLRLGQRVTRRAGLAAGAGLVAAGVWLL